MPPRITWAVPCKIVLWEYLGDISLGDVREAHRLLGELVRDCDSKVDVVIDFEEAGHVSFKLHEVAALPVNDLMQKTGETVYVGKQSSMFYRVMVDAVASVRHEDFHWFATVDEAVAFLSS